MANMIEQSLLCKVLDAPDLEILHSNGVIEEMFLTCKDEIHFIIEHYNSYKQMPDKLTFLGRFKDFQMLEVTESTSSNYNLDGILDVADTKLNDVASNLALAQEEIPLLGGVSIG